MAVIKNMLDKIVGNFTWRKYGSIFFSFLCVSGKNFERCLSAWGQIASKRRLKNGNYFRNPCSDIFSFPIAILPPACFVSQDAGAGQTMYITFIALEYFDMAPKCV